MTVDRCCCVAVDVVDVQAPLPWRLVWCGAAGADERLASDRQRIVGGAVVGCRVLVESQFRSEVVVDAAQTPDPCVEGVTITFEPRDFVDQLVDQTLHDLKLAYRLQGTLVGSHNSAAAGGHPQRLQTEQSNCRGSGLPARGSIEPQQCCDHRGLLITAPADFGQRVDRGSAAARHFLFGQVELRDPLIDDMDEPVDAVSETCHADPIAANRSRLAADFRQGFSSYLVDRFGACRY